MSGVGSLLDSAQNDREPPSGVILRQEGDLCQETLGVNPSNLIRMYFRLGAHWQALEREGERLKAAYRLGTAAAATSRLRTYLAFHTGK